MIWALAFLLCFSGLGAIALSMPKHHRAVLGFVLSTRRKGLLRALGWASLAATFALCLHGFGVAYGLVVLTALLTLAGILVALLLTSSDVGAARLRDAVK